MAVAKQQLITVDDQRRNGRTVKVECVACYDEYGSLACLRNAHSKAAKIVQDDAAPVEKEVLATAIVQIGDAMKKLEKSGLNRKGVIALINDDTKLGKGIIETVLLSLGNLAKTYTK